MSATGPIDALRDWHDFYVLIGTASATLVGLMFVAASIGAAYYNVEREAALRAFLTPTVLHAVRRLDRKKPESAIFLSVRRSVPGLLGWGWFGHYGAVHKYLDLEPRGAHMHM